MTRTIIYIFTPIFLFLTPSLNAQQQEWTLEECINYAYKHNIQLARSENQIEMSKLAVQQAKNDRLPSLSGSASFNRGYGRTIDYTTNGYTTRSSSSGSYGIGSSISLFSGFQKKHRIEKGKIDLQASLLEIEKLKEDLALNITSFYLNILYAKERLQVAKDNLTIREAQIKRMEAMIQAGTKPEGDLLEQQSQIAKAESTVIDAENTLMLNYLTLYQVLEIKENEEFLIAEPKVDMLENADNNTLNFTQTILERPSIKAYDYRIASAHKDIQIIRSGYYPSLNLSGNIGSGYSNQAMRGNNRISFSDQYELNLSKSWGVSLSIPIFNKFAIRTQVKNAVLQLKNIELQKREEENHIYKELQQAQTNAIVALKKYQAQEKATKALKETFRYVEEKYQLELISNFDYNEALNNLTNANSEMIQAKYEYIFRTKILEYYNGKPLTL